MSCTLQDLTQPDLLITFQANTSLAAPGALAHRLQRRTACNAAPPAAQHRLKNPKWPPVGPKMADGVRKGVYP